MDKHYLEHQDQACVSHAFKVWKPLVKDYEKCNHIQSQTSKRNPHIHGINLQERAKIHMQKYKVLRKLDNNIKNKTKLNQEPVYYLNHYTILKSKWIEDIF